MASPLTPPKIPPIRRASVENLYAKVLVIGPPGAGKTYLCCSLPNPLGLITEGAVSESTILYAEGQMGKEVPIWPIHTCEDLEDAWSFLKAGKHEFQSVFVDSLTDMNRLKMFEILGKQVDVDPNHEEDLMEVSGWNKLDGWTRRMVWDFRDLPMHVVMTTKILETARLSVGKGKDKAPESTIPANTVIPELYPRAIRFGIGGQFNANAYLGKYQDHDKKKEGQVLIFAGDPRFLTKPLRGFWEDREFDPDFTNLVQKLRLHKEK